MHHFNWETPHTKTTYEIYRYIHTHAHLRFIFCFFNILGTTWTEQNYSTPATKFGGKGKEER